MNSAKTEQTTPASDPRGVVGKYISLDWYDGPLLEVASVDFPDRDRMVQVCALCTTTPIEAPPTERLRGTINGEHPWERATLRLTREDLQKMLDLIDGKSIKGFHDR